VTLTEAPEIAEPDLSVTVPRKLPVAWPYAICPQQAATIQTTTAVRILLHILLTSLGNPAKLIIRIQSLKNKRSALHPQVPGTTPSLNSEEKHEMAIFRLSVPQIPDGTNQTLIPRKNIGEKLLLNGGCVK